MPAFQGRVQIELLFVNEKDPDRLGKVKLEIVGAGVQQAASTRDKRGALRTASVSKQEAALQEVYVPVSGNQSCHSR